MKEENTFLEDDKNIIPRVVQAISVLTKMKTVNKNMSSYGLKHRIEKHLKDYVSNEAMIEAMNQAGFIAQKTAVNSPNYWFNISIKEIDKFFPNKF